MQYDPSLGWEYESHPLYSTVQVKCDELLRDLSLDDAKGDAVLDDTRASHLHIYIDVTPDGHDYFAGNYRGFPQGYLENYNVRIFKYVGVYACYVENVMRDFSIEIRQLLEKFEKIRAKINDDKHRLLHYCKLIALIFTKFLVIHPYANGNGHMARLLAWVLLRKEGLNSNFWTVAERPGSPPGEPLDRCIEHFRNNNEVPLIKYFLLGIMNGTPVATSDLEDVLPTS